MFCEKTVTFCSEQPKRAYNLVIQDVSYTISETANDFYCNPVQVAVERQLYAWITLRDYVQNEEDGGVGSYTAKCYGRLVNEDGSPAFWQPEDSYLSTRWINCQFKFSNQVDQQAKIWILAFPESYYGTQENFGSSFEGRIVIQPHTV